MTPALVVIATCASLTAAAIAAAAAPPTIESESVSQITSADAVLEAQIDTNGLETSYRFRLEYGCFSTRSACMMMSEANLPTEKIAASMQSQSVSLDLNAAGVTLYPGWEYRYSVEATDSAGPTVQGPVHTFTTHQSASPPVIEAESLSDLTASDATLEARIDTEGLETT